MAIIDRIPEMDRATLEREIVEHNYHYWVRAQPRITDYAYDQLVEALKERAPDSTVIAAVGTGGAIDDPALRALITDVIAEFPPPDALETGAKVVHEQPMLSLDKCYEEETLRKWFAKFEGDVVVSPKIDGVAVSMKYRSGELVVATTRGDGVRGELITGNVRCLVGVPTKLDGDALEVRGEAYIPLSIFEHEFEEDYANPRNLTAGGIKQKDPKKTARYKIHFFAYDLIGETFETEVAKFERLRQLGFDTVDPVLVGEAELQSVYDDLLAGRGDNDFEADGVVYKCNRVDEQERMGVTSHHPRYAIAYKFQGDSDTSVLREVRWSVSRTGAINPVAIVDPVELSGAMVSRISLHNLSIMEGLGRDGVLNLGSEVVVMRRGGVIPNLETVSQHGDEPVEVPAECPSCGAPTYRDGDVLFAHHTDSCRVSRLKELEHFISTIKADGYGEKIVAQLYDAGLVRTPADFFRLTPEALMTLERMGTKLANKLVANVQELRTMDGAVFLRALGIHELGKHVSKILAQQYGSIDRILAVTEAELAEIHTIGDVIAEQVVGGLAEQRNTIDELLEYVTPTWPTPASRSEGSTGPLTGKSFLFTGAMATMKRKDAQTMVEQLGGKAASGVTKSLDYLVLGDKDMPRFEEGWRSSKLKKAESLISAGATLRILSESEFRELAEAGDVP